MNNKGTSQWAAAWATLLFTAVLWVAMDQGTADRVIETVVVRRDLNQILAVGFVVFGALNLFALAYRILTWHNE